MNKPKLLLTAEVDEGGIAPLFEMCDVVEDGYRFGPVKLTEEQQIEKLKGCKIFMTSYDAVTAKVIENAPDLKLIVCARSNPINVDLAAAKAKGITVVYTPGRNSDCTAEFAVALMLMAARKIPQALSRIADGSYLSNEPIPQKKDVTWGVVNGHSPYNELQGMQLFGRTLGIVGYGSIGRRVGRIAHQGFGMYLNIYDPYANELEVEAPGIRKVDFDTLLRESDFISCHVKPTPATTGLFTLDCFKKMKPTAFFINNGRGNVVVEKDLIEALRQKLIAGAALDVFENEPLEASHPYVSGELDNVVVTPHMSGAAIDSMINHTKMAVAEVRRYLAGEPLLFSK